MQQTKTKRVLNKCPTCGAQYKNILIHETTPDHILKTLGIIKCMYTLADGSMCTKSYMNPKSYRSHKSRKHVPKKEKEEREDNEKVCKEILSDLIDKI